MDPREGDFVDAMVKRQQRLATLGWIVTIVIVLGGSLLYLTVLNGLVTIVATTTSAGIAAAGARAASRRAKLIADGVDTSDLDLEF